MTINFIIKKAPGPVTTRISGWLYQGGIPPITGVRIVVDKGKGESYLDLTDHLNSDVVASTATIDQYTDSCEGGTYGKTECNFSFTADAGSIFTMQMLYDGSWDDCQNEDLPFVDPDVDYSCTVPNTDSTITLGCDVY